MVSMTRQHFAAIAEVIAGFKIAYRDAIYRAFRDLCASSNPNFDEGRFYAACYPEGAGLSALSGWIATENAHGPTNDGTAWPAGHEPEEAEIVVLKDGCDDCDNLPDNHPDWMKGFCEDCYEKWSATWSRVYTQE